MKVDTQVFGLKFDVELPFNSVEEFDQLAGKAGACLDEAVQHVIAHKHLTRVRSAVVSKLEKLTGIERGKTTDESGKNVKYTESEQVYFRRCTGTWTRRGLAEHTGRTHSNGGCSTVPARSNTHSRKQGRYEYG